MENQKKCLEQFEAQIRDCTKTSEDCHRDYVLVERLKCWLKENIGDLVEACHAESAEKPGVNRVGDSIMVDSPLIFCILLHLKLHRYMDVFFRLFNDNHLPIKLDTLLHSLEAERVPDPEKVAQIFDGEQHKFCAPQFEYDFSKSYDSACIFPFKKKHLISKGGTASVYHVEIFAEFVGSELRKMLEDTVIYHDDTLGQYYQFALKIFTSDNEMDYRNERKAYQSLRETEGVIKSFYTYDRKSPDATNDEKTYGILEEYGNMDLEEYFATVEPPFLWQEVLDIWRELFDLAKAVKGIHTVLTPRGGYRGVHGDIKPANILIVKDRFKLSDPGFATFKRVSDGEDPRMIVRGGTFTYSAPEHTPTRHGPVTSHIDIWSLGAVFLIAATWIIGGKSAMCDFEKVRQMAFKKLPDPRESWKKLGGSDTFHDGEKVHSEVLEWLKTLRPLVKKADNITEPVLDIIEEEMLQPKERISAEDLVNRLDGIMAKAESVEEGEPSKRIWEALNETNNETIKFSPSSKGRSQTPTCLNRRSWSSDRKTRKSIAVNTPLKPTAGRSRVLKSHLQSSSFSQRRTKSEMGDAAVQSPLIITTGSAAKKESNGALVADCSTKPDEIASPMEELPTPNTLLAQRRKKRTIGEAKKHLRDQRRGSIRYINDKRKADPFLSESIRNRDFVFLIDNAVSMNEHWPRVTDLVNTMVQLLYQQDDDGFDLLFTRGKEYLTNETREKAFKKKLDQVRCGEGYTDLEEALGRVFGPHLRKLKQKTGVRKAFTLYVITDGRWEGPESQKGVQDCILKFMKDVQKYREGAKRFATIQFIQFGTFDAANRRLRYLDDDFHKRFKEIPDVIDTEHVDNDDIDKMILGSISEEMDRSWSR